MAEELKIKIRNTEAATVEIIPTDDGIEISIVRKENPKKETPVQADSTEEFRSFCTKMKEKYRKDKTLLADLRKFWDWYSPKMSEWKGKLDCEKLWTRWCSTRQGSDAKYTKKDFED